MKRKKFFFNETERAQIKAAIQKAESKTSGEIVPVVARGSDHYRWVELLWALAGWCLASIVLILAHRFNSQWYFTLSEILLVQSLLVILGFGISQIPWIRRLTVPQKIRSQYVHQHCLATFLKLGLTETKRRTGVLIYLSRLERKVEILADRGIYSKTPPGYWDEQVKKIVSGIHAGNAADQLCEVIEKISETLAQHFPREADDENELGDDVREEDEES